MHQMVHKIDIGKINLVIASTAGVSCARLFDSINYTTAFGLELLKDCLDPRDLHSRLAQERLMSESNFIPVPNIMRDFFLSVSTDGSLIVNWEFLDSNTFQKTDSSLLLTQGFLSPELSNKIYN